MEEHDDLADLASLPGGRTSYHARNVELWRQYQTGDAAAKQEAAAEFLRLNEPLVRHAAAAWSRSGDDSEDLLQEARLQMWVAFTGWDPAKGAFATFALRGMRGRTSRGAAKVMHGSGMSRKLFELRPKVHAAVAKLEGELGRSPSDQEVATTVGATVEMVAGARRERAISLSTPLGDSTAGDLGDLLAGQMEDPTSSQEMAHDELEGRLASLTPLQLWIVLRHHGLDGAPTQTLFSLAADLGVGRRIAQDAAQKAVSLLSV